MTIREFFNTCDNIPQKIKALLYQLGAEEEDYDKWTIDYDGVYICHINDIEYEIYNSSEIKRILTQIWSDRADDAILELPQWAVPYFDREQWIQDAIDYNAIEDAIEGVEDIFYEENFYYYVEL